MEDIPTTFARDGVVVLRGAFSSDDAAFLRDMMWRHIESTTPVRSSERGTWRFEGNFGLRVVETRDVWHVVHDSERVVAALSEVFGGEGGTCAWTTPGPPQILLTFPSVRPWLWPTGWHADFGWDVPTWPVRWVKMFALLDTVESAGGGTLLVRGSHRVVAQLAEQHGRPIDPWDATMRPLQSPPYAPLDALLSGTPGADRSMLDQPIEVGDDQGLTVSAMEVTGEPGDVVLAHIQVFHSPAPNATDRPRLMIGNAFNRAR